MDKRKESAKKFGCSISSDGWKSPAHRDLMNIMVMTSDGPFFHGALDTSQCDTTQGKDAAFVADYIIKAISEIGPENVVSVVTDGASVMKAAWVIIEKNSPKSYAHGVLRTFLTCFARILAR